jgi:HAD superfamily hydrolase (TIGR01662 family)
MARRADARLAAVFFDVDFTLIYPGPTFQGEGYERFCARHGITVDRARFDDAVRAASSVLDDAQDHVYDPDIFVGYTRRVIEEMGGRGDRLDDCAREIYDEWASCQHFFLYDDVAPVLRELASRGLKLGLISNSHRCLTSFQEHFELQGLIAAAVSSAEHGYMKPHPSIFEAALSRAGVTASESMMVGDSLTHDIEGALRVGMRGLLVHRSGDPPPEALPIPVIRSLAELPRLL